MKDYRKWIDSLPLLLQIILALPALDGIFYGLFRIASGKLSNVILGIIWIVIGATIFWILDIIFLILGKRPLEF